MIFKFNQTPPDFHAASEKVAASQHKVPTEGIRRLTQAWPFRAKCADVNAQTAGFSGRDALNESSFVT